MENVYEAVAVIVALIFSIILWFSWLGLSDYTVNNVISTTVQWLIGVVLLTVGATLIGFSANKVKATLKYEGADIWEAIAAIVGVLLTVIVWFQWLGAQDYSVATVITTAIIWIVATLVLSLGAVFIGYFQDELKKTLS